MTTPTKTMKRATMLVYLSLIACHGGEKGRHYVMADAVKDGNHCDDVTVVELGHAQDCASDALMPKDGINRHAAAMVSRHGLGVSKRTLPFVELSVYPEGALALL